MNEPRIVPPEEARALLAAATPGPWDRYGNMDFCVFTMAYDDDDYDPPAITHGSDREADAQLIVNARDLAHTSVVLGYALKRVEAALDDANAMHDRHADALNGLIADCVGCLADSIRAALAGDKS